MINVFFNKRFSISGSLCFHSHFVIWYDCISSIDDYASSSVCRAEQMLATTSTWNMSFFKRTIFFVLVLFVHHLIFVLLLSVCACHFLLIVHIWGSAVLFSVCQWMSLIYLCLVMWLRLISVDVNAKRNILSFRVRQGIRSREETEIKYAFIKKH